MTVPHGRGPKAGGSCMIFMMIEKPGWYFKRKKIALLTHATLLLQDCGSLKSRIPPVRALVTTFGEFWTLT
jgi:hypothetical protein